MAGPIRVPVEDTLRRLLAQEDTDGDLKITVKDEGPRRFLVQGDDGSTAWVEGTYPLSNLLQELARAREAGGPALALDPAVLHESPVRRLSRRIREEFWDGLTRRIDGDGLVRILADSKAGATRSRLYVPATDPQALAYFEQVSRDQAGLNLLVVRLPERVTAEYVLTINREPGS